MDLDYYENLSDDAALHKWPRDGSKLRAGPQGDRTDKNGHAGYATSLLERVQAKAGEIDAALQAQGTFTHTSQFAKDYPLIQILSRYVYLYGVRGSAVLAQMVEEDPSKVRAKKITAIRT